MISTNAPSILSIRSNNRFERIVVQLAAADKRKPIMTSIYCHILLCIKIKRRCAAHYKGGQSNGKLTFSNDRNIVIENRDDIQVVYFLYIDGFLWSAYPKHSLINSIDFQLVGVNLQIATVSQESVCTAVKQVYSSPFPIFSLHFIQPLQHNALPKYYHSPKF